MPNQVNERFLAIAASIDDRRVVSKRKAKVIDKAELAECVQRIANSPDPDNHGAQEPANGYLRCAVCELWKDGVYFKATQHERPDSVRICRYCNWRLRTEVDRRFRELEGLEPRPEPAPTKPPEPTAEVASWLEARRGVAPTETPRGIVTEGAEATSTGDSESRFARLDPVWYRKTTEPNYAVERDAMSAWWDADCDLVVEWFLRRYGMFAGAFDDVIKSQITRHLKPDVEWARYFCHFIRSRIFVTPHLRSLLLDDFAKRGRADHRCRVCDQVQDYASLHHDRIRWSDGVVLPLCNDCWRILESGCFPEIPSGVAPADFDEHIEAVLGRKLCPVCDRDHTWRDSAYTYTDGFYGIPPRFREICFDCLDLAINRSPKDRRIMPQRAGLLLISELIGDLPKRTMAEVIFEQSPNVDVATQVVVAMQSMWTFDRLASRHGKSWFAALVKSGCLPEGSRKEHFGTRVLARDGHECLSMGEMHIDNLFHRNRIPHKKEVRYPGSNYVCDWVVELDGREVYVEYFGLAGQDDYDEKIVAKRSLAAEAGLTLVEFLPEDMRDLEAAFERKFMSLD